jgi:hypothetical protein
VSLRIRERNCQERSSSNFTRAIEFQETGLLDETIQPVEALGRKQSGASNEFLGKFKTAIHGVMKNGYAVDVSKLTALEVN